MNKDIYIDYCLKNALKEKNRKKMTIILVLVSIIIIFLFSFKNTITNFFTNGVIKDIGYRTLFVLRDDELYTEKEMIEQLKNIKHVSEVFPDREYYTVLNIKGNDFNGTISLTGSSDNTHPIISYGKNLKYDNEIICPEKFYPDENIIENKTIKNNEFINMKKHIGETILIDYRKIIDEQNYSFEKKQMKLKIVGTYKNSPAFVDESRCYGTYHLVGKITNDIYENVDMTSQTDSIMVQVDSLENIESVIKEISKKGHLVSQALSFDNTLLNIITKATYIILIISFIFVISIIMYINNRDYENSISRVNILRSIGFKDKDIFKINYFEKNILGINIFIILSIIISILILAYKILIYYKPFIFSKIPITLDSSSILITFILIITSTNFCTFVFNKKISKSNVIEGLKE